MVKPPTTQNHHGWKNPHMICAHGTQLPPNLLFRARSGSGPAQPRQGYDVSMDALQDIGLVLGFLNALHLMLRIRAKGLAWLAIPCNSFNFMSSSQHQRSFWQPYGNQHMPWVVMGNEVCTRSSMLILVGIVRRVVFFCGESNSKHNQLLALFQPHHPQALAIFFPHVMEPSLRLTNVYVLILCVQT